MKISARCSMGEWGLVFAKSGLLNASIGHSVADSFIVHFIAQSVELTENGNKKCTPKYNIRCIHLDSESTEEKSD